MLSKFRRPSSHGPTERKAANTDISLVQGLSQGRPGRYGTLLEELRVSGREQLADGESGFSLLALSICGSSPVRTSCWSRTGLETHTAMTPRHL